VKPVITGVAAVAAIGLALTMPAFAQNTTTIPNRNSFEYQGGAAAHKSSIGQYNQGGASAQKGPIGQYNQGGAAAGKSSIGQYNQGGAAVKKNEIHQ